MPVEEQVAAIYAATNGYVDRIAADRVEEFHRGLVERLHSSASDTLEKIADGDWGDDTQKGLDKAIKEFAEDFGYDLDEEGQPLSDESEDAATSRGRKDDDDDSSSSDEESSEDTEKAGAAA